MVSTRCTLVVLLALITTPLRALDRAAAYALLSDRVTENRQSFFVYKDADSSANHGFPSGFFGSFHKIEADAACIDDPASATGCSMDPTRVERSRGNVLRISFQPLGPAEFAGVNIEEPEHWGAQVRGIGHDVRGATELVFDVRSPTPGGVRVQFGIGGRTAPFVDIAQSASYQTITIPLSSLHPAPDLADVHILFTVVTNGEQSPNGGTVLLDDIRLTPAPDTQRVALGFPLSTQTFGIVPVQDSLPGRVPIPPDQVNRNAATIYESALVLQALLARGSTADLDHATIIADTFVYALDHDNRGLALPHGPDHARGLHSGYESGDIALRNDQAPGAGQAGDVRIAGFSASARQCGSSRYCPILDDATAGNAAFAILGLLRAHDSLGDARYLDAARRIGTWIYANLRDPATNGFGGYFFGYPGGGQPKTEVLRSKLTEANAAVFVAFSRLAAAGQSDPSDAGSDEWTRRADIAGDFVMQMFDATRGRFFAGTVTANTGPSEGIDPTGPARGNDRVNAFDYLDAHAMAVLALAESPRYRTKIDWRRPVQWLAAQGVAITVDGNAVDGYSIVRTPSGGPAGIAWEFTGQAIVAMRVADCLYGESQFASTIAGLMERMSWTQRDAPFGDARGLVASTLQDGDAVPPREQCLSTPFQCIPQRVGLAATAWAIFADAALNPLSMTNTLQICPHRPRRRSVRK